ncbi:MAG: RecX family transcriptional regulator [Turicibacter sp.]|nr:RecX family transcriptional regulator [Turicibacter sp.]
MNKDRGCDFKMIGKESETYVVVTRTTPHRRGEYQVELGDAQGNLYEFSVHEETMLDYRLVVGKELDEQTFRALEASKDYGAAYSYAVGILARRMYTEKELRQKLVNRETNEGVIEEVVTKLFQLDLLNDDAFARTFIEEQVRMGKKSQRRIVSDLYAKGVADKLIDRHLGLFDQEAETGAMKREIEKAYERFSRKELSDFELKNKVIQAVGRKGFDFYEMDRQYGYFIEDLEVDI